MTDPTESQSSRGSEVCLQDNGCTVENASDLPRLYSPETVAKAFELRSPSWLIEAARDQRIPYTRLGRQLRFTLDQVKRVIEVHEVKEVANPLPVEQPTPQESQRRRPAQRSTEKTTQRRRLHPRIPARMRND